MKKIKIKKLLDLIKSIPPNSEIPCSYLFQDYDCYEEGFIVSNTCDVYLKHNHISHRGYGSSYKRFKYSWFLYGYEPERYDLDGVLNIILGSCPLGEL